MNTYHIVILLLLEYICEKQKKEKIQIDCFNSLGM